VSDVAINDARGAAEKALDDGRVDDAVRLAEFVAEHRTDPRAAELLGRTLIALASVRAQQNLPGAAIAVDEARRRAADAYRLAAARDPANAALQDAAAQVIDSAGDLAGAQALYDRAVELEPLNTTYRLHRGNARLRRGDIEGADQDVEAMIERPDGWAHALRAQVRLAQQRTAEAVAAATAARAQAPGDLAFRVLLARALRADGQPQAAVELLTGLSPHERTDESVAYELGLAWSAIDRHDKAAETWAHAYRGTANKSVRAALEAGRAFLRAGDRASAKSWLDIARLLDADNPGVQELASLIGAAATTQP